MSYYHLRKLLLVLFALAFFISHALIIGLFSDMSDMIVFALDFSGNPRSWIEKRYFMGLFTVVSLGGNALLWWLSKAIENDHILFDYLPIPWKEYWLEHENLRSLFKLKMELVFLCMFTLLNFIGLIIAQTIVQLSVPTYNFILLPIDLTIIAMAAALLCVGLSIVLLTPPDTSDSIKN